MTIKQLIELGSELLEEVGLGGELEKLEKVLEDFEVIVEGTDKDELLLAMIGMLLVRSGIPRIRELLLYDTLRAIELMAEFHRFEYCTKLVLEQAVNRMSKAHELSLRKAMLN
jgi:hypothetical protein